MHRSMNVKKNINKSIFFNTMTRNILNLSISHRESTGILFFLSRSECQHNFCQGISTITFRKTVVCSVTTVRHSNLSFFIPDYKHKSPAALKAVITFFCCITELHTAQSVSQQVLHKGCS